MFWKKQLPLIIAFVMGFLLLIQYFIPGRVSQDFLRLFQDWGLVIGVFGAVMGYYSIIRVHIVKITKGVKGWYFSAVTLLCIATMVVGWLVQGVETGTIFDNLFNYALVPIESTVFSLLAFYIASAAYRAFRARSAQATALLIAAMILMLGRVPIGQYIRIGDTSLVDVANWILNYPNMAAKRGILLGVGLGQLLMSLKIILGIERAYLGGKD
ncbi:MAG: hypothetical protein ACLFSQ_06490 [Candidatus Zixiibacteriota bacterium]